MSSAEQGARDQLAARLEQLRADHLRAVEELRAGERRFRALARRVWQVEEAERRRLARELHDGVGQMLTALKNELARLAAQAPDDDAAQRLTAAARHAADALDATRQLSRRLRPTVLDDLGLVAALRGLARSLAESAGFEVELRCAGPLEALAPEVETLLYRIAQEGLNNALKHSGTVAAELEIERRGDRVRLSVRDHGRGGSAPGEASRGSEGMGLRSIRDRVEAFGGRVRFEAPPGAGARLTVELTLEDEA